MPITYPLTMPTTVRPMRFDMRGRDVVGRSESPFSLAVQTYQHSGNGWRFEIEFSLMTRANAAAMIAFLDANRGGVGSFLAGDPSWSAPLGTGVGTPLVNGVNAIRSTTLATKGWGASQVVLKAGDLFQLGTGATTRLYRNLTDATTDGSGNVTLDIWPPLRAATANNDPIVISNPRGIWRMADGSRGYEVVPPFSYKIAFAAIEKLP